MITIAPDRQLTRRRLAELINQIDLDEQLRLRAAQDAISDAMAETWVRRAEMFDWASCPGEALACRRKAAVINYEAGAELVDPAEVA